MQVLHQELYEKLSCVADTYGYLIDFNPDCYKKECHDFYQIRNELISLEKKHYINYFMNGSTIVIQMKCFVLMDEIIDEMDSYWIEEDIIFDIVVENESTSANEIVELFLEKCRENNI